MYAKKDKRKIKEKKERQHAHTRKTDCIFIAEVYLQRGLCEQRRRDREWERKREKSSLGRIKSKKKR